MIALSASAMPRISLPAQTLSYDADYHYGFIKISAGTATISLNLDGNKYMATMNGQSIPIGGHIYAISDTLRATMTPTTSGLSRETVSYKNGWYAKPTRDDATPSDLFSNPALYKNTCGGGSLDASPETMEAVSISTDMLAMFYYFRQMDFDAMAPGQVVNITIRQPGTAPQNLVVTYDGQGAFEGADTYKVTFNFSYHGEMTDYPITAEIDPLTRLPLLLSAELKIGHIELRLTEDTF